MAGGPQWQQVDAPGFADVSQILRNAAASWSEGMGGLGETLGNAANNQRRVRSNEILPELGRIASEGDVNGFLNDLPGMINANDMSPELTAAVSALRETAQGYDQNRAQLIATQAGTAGLIGGERRQQGLYDRQLAEDQGLIELSSIFANMGITAFNQDGIAVNQQGQPVIGQNGQPVTQQQATAAAQAQLPAGALPSDPQARAAAQYNASVGAPQGANGSAGGRPPANENIFEGFMGTVRDGGLTNPYALAAVAATVQHESGFSEANAGRTWSDPSESGRPGTAGGLMSWNNERLSAMQQFTGGDASAEAQAAFFLNEDPALIARLNNAGSLEEAQTMMNNAWRFAGYNREGGEAAARLRTAQGMLGRFEGGQANTNGPSGDNGYRARLDPAAAGAGPGFDWSMGGRVRASTLQPLLTGAMDQATMGADESRTARNDQQKYVDSIRQMQEDQITFAQTQEDRTRTEQQRADEEAGRNAALLALRNSDSLGAAQTALTNDPTLNPNAVAAAQAALGVMGTEGQFTPTTVAAGAPGMAAEETAMNEFMNRSEFDLNADEATRINRRAVEVVGDTDPAQYLLGKIDGLDMEESTLRDMISNIARENSISPASAAVIMEENIDRGSFWRMFPGGKRWGGSYFNEEDTNEMIRTAFSPEARRASDELVSTVGQEQAAAQTAFGQMQDAQSRISLWAERNGGDWASAPQNLRDQYDQAAAQLREITGGEGVSVDGGVGAGSGNTTIVAQVNGQSLNAQQVAQLPPEQRTVVEASIAATDYLRTVDGAGRLSDPNISPEARNTLLASLARRVDSDRNLTPEQRQQIKEGLSQMAQGNVGLANQ